MILCAALLASCGQVEVPTDTAPRFCDVETKRLFTREEIDWRAKNAPWNLRLDLATNETGVRTCGWIPADGGDAVTPTGE